MTVKTRILSGSCHFGLFPFLPARYRQKNAIVDSHYRRAAMFFLLFLSVIPLALLDYAISTLLILSSSSAFQAYDDLDTRLSLLMIYMLVLAVLWIRGLAWALFAKQVPNGFLQRLSQRDWLVRISRGSVILSYVVALSLTIVAHKALELTRPYSDEPAAAYVVYDDMDLVPRWVFAVGFMKISMASEEVFGPGQIVVAPLDQRSLRRALEHGRFVFVASHGIDGHIFVPEGDGIWLSPTDVGAMEQGSSLQFVYLAACEAGKIDGWQRALAPAEVQSFDRTSATAEHIQWLWSEGPRVLRDLN